MASEKKDVRNEENNGAIVHLSDGQMSQIIFGLQRVYNDLVEQRQDKTQANAYTYLDLMIEEQKKLLEKFAEATGAEDYEVPDYFGN